MFFIVGSLVTGTLADWDDENMKKAKDSRDIDDAAIAAAAHMACKMVSSSFLDLNFIESIGGPLVSWQPMSFSYFSRRAEALSGSAVHPLRTKAPTARIIRNTVPPASFANTTPRR